MGYIPVTIKTRLSGTGVIQASGVFAIDKGYYAINSGRLRKVFLGNNISGNFDIFTVGGDTILSSSTKILPTLGVVKKASGTGSSDFQIFSSSEVNWRLLYNKNELYTNEYIGEQQEFFDGLVLNDYIFTVGIFSGSGGEKSSLTSGKIVRLSKNNSSRFINLSTYKTYNSDLALKTFEPRFEINGAPLSDINYKSLFAGNYNSGTLNTFGEQKINATLSFYLFSGSISSGSIIKKPFTNYLDVIGNLGLSIRDGTSGNISPFGMPTRYFKLFSDKCNFWKIDWRRLCF